MGIKGATEHYMRELKLNMRYSFTNKNAFTTFLAGSRPRNAASGICNGGLNDICSWKIFSICVTRTAAIACSAALGWVRLEFRDDGSPY